MPLPSERATEVVTGRAAEQYGSPTPICETTANLWNEWLRIDATDEVLTTISPTDVAMMMALHKMARERHRHVEDNLTDIAGYVNVYEMVREEQP